MTLAETAQSLGAKPIDPTLDFDLKDFQFDPYTASFPQTMGRMITNTIEKSPLTYNEKSGKPAVPQWVMAFEDGLRQDWNDETIPRIIINRVNLGYWRTKGQDGIELDEPILVKSGRNSTSVEFAATVLEKLTFPLKPDQSDEYLDQWFELVQMTFASASPYPKKMWVPVRLIGRDIPDAVIAYRKKREQEVAGNW